jgi:DNA-directed RNA polymerase subunit M/transcription elongation factor TFIIS
MGEAADQFVTCPTCQKRFRWRADVVGKKFNCPCGAALTVPPQPGPATVGSPAPGNAPAAPAAAAPVAPPPPPAAAPAAPKPVATPAEPPVVKGTGANAILERPPREEEDEGTYDLADPDEPPETSNRPATLASTPAPAAKPAAAATSHAAAPKAAAAVPVAAPVKAAEPAHAAAPTPAKPAAAPVASAPVTPAPSKGNIASLDAPIGLGGLSIRHDPKCPSCGNFVKADAVICVNCGYQMQSGEKVKTEVTTQEEGSTGGKGFKGAMGAVFGLLKRKKADDGATPLVTAEAPPEDGTPAPGSAPGSAPATPAAAAEEKKDSKVKGLMGKITGAVKRK